MSDCNNTGSFLSGMLFGLLVGGALGLLYAPQSVFYPQNSKVEGISAEWTKLQ